VLPNLLAHIRFQNNSAVIRHCEERRDEAIQAANSGR